MSSVISPAIQRERRVKLFFFLVALLGLFLVITQTPNLLISFLLALVTHSFLAPVVDFLERKRLPRVLAVSAPFLITALVIGLSLNFFLPTLLIQLNELQVSLPKYFSTASGLLTRLELQVNTRIAQIYPLDIRGTIEPYIVQFTEGFVKKLPSLLSNSLTVLVLTPFLAFFMLLDGRDFIRRLLTLVPNNVFELALNLNYQVMTQISGFIRARVIEGLLIAMIIWMGLLYLDFPYSLLLASFAGLINIIPYVGPLLGAIPAVIIHLANSGQSQELIWLLAIYGGAQIIDTALIVPFIVAKIVDLHPVVVVLAVIIGAQTMGILGMIISIPLFSALKVSFSAIYQHMTDFRS
ncbi:MAG: AI-2E family transporter [Proteobacteria bacterium]|jgi:putative permease|nr:AI-2E family transporter [Pseudomonadota bacterium]